RYRSRYCSGLWPKSLASHHNPPSRVLLLLRDLLLQLAHVFDRLAGTEILQLEQLAYLDLGLPAAAIGLEGNALGPFDGLFLRLHLNQPIAGDQFLRLDEGAVDHGTLPSRELDARALRARLEPRGVEQRAGFHQLLVVLSHSGQELLAWHNARF